MQNVTNENESVSDLIRFSTRNSSRLECEVERNSAVNSLNNIDIQDAFNSFMEDRIENLNEDEISGDFSSILKEFLVFDNDESVASNKQQQLQQKTNNNKIAIPGKDSAIYMWDRKYYKRCPKCPLRQTLEHVMLVNHQRFEESFKEIEDEEVENEEEEGEFDIDENSGNFSGGQRNDGGNLIFEQEEEYDENNEENNIVEESDLVNNTNEEENGWELVEEENYISEGENSTFTDDEEQQTPTTLNNNKTQLNVKNNEKKNFCNLCNMQFSSPRGLSIHNGKNKRHKDLLLTTTRMANLMVSNSSNNTTTNNNNNTSNLFLCDSPGCKSIFESPDKLKVHQRRLHTVRNYACNTCGRAYINEGWLKKHKNEKGH
uniref:C2H2-type domain-containing protein n=1 Tax=Meloidogyne incognita TaxID=6306 RepID=A0A914M3J4_MELIC